MILIKLSLLFIVTAEWVKRGIWEGNVITTSKDNGIVNGIDNNVRDTGKSSEGKRED